MRLRSKPKFHFAAVLPWLGLLLFVTIAWAILQQDPAYVFRIEGMRFGPGTPSISIGANDPITIKNKHIDTGFFTLQRQGDSWRWLARKPFYLKLNGESINKLEFKAGNSIEFYGRTVSFAQVKDSIDKYPNQAYFDLHDLAGDGAATPGVYAYSHSLVYRHRPPWWKVWTKTQYFVILLEEGVRLISENGRFGTNTTGTIKTKDLSVEFVVVDTAAFVSDGKPLLRNKNINVPTIRTEWQASRINFSANDDRSISAYYSQPLSVLISETDIQKIRNYSGARTIHLTQESGIYDKRNFNFEKFSSAYPLPLASILLPENDNTRLQLRFARTVDNSGHTFSVEPLSLNEDKEFNVRSPLGDVSVIGKQYRIGRWRLAIPFICLLLLFLTIGLLIRRLTDSHGESFYAQSLRRRQAEVDANRINQVTDRSNRAFWSFRYPILWFVLSMLCLKLVIAQKLAFTYPFFPHLYFPACAMAFSTPIFIAYFWIRNSWNLPGSPLTTRNIRSIFFLDLGLTAATSACLFLAWQVAGKPFYAHYFKAFSYNVSIGTGIDLMRNNNDIFKEKIFQVPVIILSLPVAILAFDLLSALLGKKLASLIEKRFGELREQFDARFFILRFLIDNGLLFILSIALMIFGAFYLPAHFLAIIICFLMASWQTGKWQGSSRELNPNTDGKNRDWSRGLLRALLLVGLGMVIVFIGRGDPGFLINYSLVAMFLLLLFSFNLVRNDLQNKKKWHYIPITSFVAFGLFMGLVVVYSKWTPPGLTDTGRSNRRIMSLADPDKALATGGRLYLSDLQFFQIMKVNALESFKHPTFKLIDREKPLHPQISRGLNPVAINDLNPLQVIDFGGWWIVTLIFLMWLALFLGRLRLFTAGFDIGGKSDFAKRFNFIQMVRWIPALIILGNSVWMMISIFGLTIFTGRVINGWGVDSIVDWFELICLSAFLGYVMVYTKKDLDKT